MLQVIQDEIQDETKKDVSKHNSSQSIELDKEDLRTLKKHKLISLETYVYLAVKIDYGDNGSVNIHIESFCDKWKLKEYEVNLAIATLQKKGLMCELDKDYVQLDLFDIESEEF